MQTRLGEQSRLLQAKMNKPEEERAARRGDSTEAGKDLGLPPSPHPDGEQETLLGESVCRETATAERRSSRWNDLASATPWPESHVRSDPGRMVLTPFSELERRKRREKDQEGTNAHVLITRGGHGVTDGGDGGKDGGRIIHVQLLSALLPMCAG